jgi:hypothetical protein
MPVTLIIEDGTGVTDANTYGTVAGARAYAADRGVTLLVDDNAVAIQLITAMDYLLLYSTRWQGERVLDAQSLDWPRKCVYVRGSLWASNVIPPDLVRAQYQLVMAQHSGLVLFPANADGKQFVIEETVGPITTKYSEAYALVASSSPLLTSFEALLSSLLNYGGGPTRSYRV